MMAAYVTRYKRYAREELVASMRRDAVDVFRPRSFAHRSSRTQRRHVTTLYSLRHATLYAIAMAIIAYAAATAVMMLLSDIRDMRDMARAL